MSSNLVSTIMQSLSPEAIGKVASSLGLEHSIAQKAITAAVPGLLAGLANTASSSDGAHKLGTVLSEINETQGNEALYRSLPEAGNKNIVESGWSMISSLMGTSSLDTLSSALAQYVGIGQGSIKKLLGFLTPIVLGVLKHEQISAGLDNRGVASLLMSQRSNIERAMPPGVLRRQQDSEARPARQPSSPSQYRPPVSSAASSRSWAYWLLPALIIAGAALYLLPANDESRTAQQIGQPAAPTGQPVPAKDTAQLSPPSQRELAPTPATTAPAVATSNTGQSTPGTIENDILANISRLRTSLQNVKDPATAQAAIGELREITDRFTRLKAIAQQLSPETRKALAAAVAAKVPDLNSLVDRINAEVPSTGEAKPTMDILKDTLKSNLTSLSKA